MAIRDKLKKIFKKKIKVKLTEPIPKLEPQEEQQKQETSIEKPTEKKPTGINKKLEDISEQLDLITQKSMIEKRYKKKTFKLPSKVKSKLKKLAVKNKAQVILLQENMNIKPTIGEIKNGMLIIGEYIGEAVGVWLWNGKFPTYIVPEWDLKPLSKDSIDGMRGISTISKEELMNDTIDNNRLSYPEQIIIRAMELKEGMMGQKKLSGKAVIWIMIGLAVIGYVLFGGGVGGG